MKKIYFKENLNELMKTHNLSQQQVANAIGVSQRAISKWLIGQSEPTATNLFKLCIYFDVSSDFLIGLSDV